MTRSKIDHDDEHATALLGSEAVDMIRARFRMVLADNIWITDVSTAFPDATLRLLTGVPKGDRALELGEVRAENPQLVTDAIKGYLTGASSDSSFLSIPS